MGGLQIGSQAGSVPGACSKGFPDSLTGEEVERAVHAVGKLGLLAGWGDHFAKGPAIGVDFEAGTLKIDPKIARRSDGVIEAVAIYTQTEPFLG